MGSDEYTPLKTFIQKHALAYQANSLAQTYGIFEAGGTKVQAYITVTCGEVQIEEDVPVEHPQPVRYDYHFYPAMKIARLAVPTSARGSGAGRQLVEFALGIAKELICPHVGCRFVVVDSKKSSVNFYKKCGFTMLDTPSNREREHPVMFIDLSKIPRNAADEDGEIWRGLAKDCT